ncbi:uncharacterized protein [Littorina saxatilis]|uniref:C2H2-type domain-containing protein n=1 Tax=Littorina saxatilis TaxID=31220 RepID=A0AAN9FZ73_9CAEN
MPTLCDRTFVTRLRESVLAVCRETLASPRPCLIDGIVTISQAEDEDRVDNRGDDGCHPIVVRIHEQVSKPRNTSSEFCQKRPSLTDDDGEDLRTENVKERRKEVLPMDRKNQILKRVFDSQTRPSQKVIVPPSRSLSAPVFSTFPFPVLRQMRKKRNHHAPGRRQGLVEAEVSDEDGHLSDPTPVQGRSGHRLYSQSSVDSDKTSSTLENHRDAAATQAEDDRASRGGSQTPPERLPSRTPLSAAAPLPSENLSCGRCGVKLADVLSLDRHNLKQHVCYTCHVCLATFTVRNNLKRHARRHTGIKPYKCQTCDASFTRRDDLKTHKQRHGHNGHNGSVTNGGLDHARRHEKHCPLCPFVAPGKHELRRHLVTHPRATALCSPCDLNFSDPSQYSAHMYRHSADPNFRCYVCCLCPQVLPSYTLFIKHQQTHTRRHLSLHDCTQCCKRFQSTANLLAHEATHDDGCRSRSHEPTSEQRPASAAGSLYEDNALGPDYHQDQRDPRRPESRQEEPKDEGKDERREASSGPKQAWCTECHLGFPDEDTLIRHITTTHENGRHQGQDSPLQAATKARANCYEADGMDTEENEIALEELDEGRSRDQTKSVVLRGVAETRDTTGCEQAERMSDGREESSGNRESLESRFKPSAVLGHTGYRQLPQGVSSFTASSVLHRASSVTRESSPLRVIPLALNHNQPPSASRLDNYMQLTKPKGLKFDSTFCPALPGPPPSSPALSPPGAFHDRSPPLTTTPSVIPPAHSQPPDNTRALYPPDNFLRVERSPPPSPFSGKANRSYLSPRAPELKQELKQEPLSDPEERAYLDRDLHLPNPECPLAPRGFLGMVHSYPPRLSPELPTDLSKSRSTSSSPRSPASDASNTSSGCGNGKGPSFEKVVTPEVLFKDRCPVPCPHKDCGQQFQAFCELEEHHLRQHQRHLCEYCGSSFTAKPNRDRHVRYHTGHKPYKCALCNQAFFRGDDLKYHRTTKHHRESGM